jgi:ABC-2 type transport system permease protein
VTSAPPFSIELRTHLKLLWGLRLRTALNRHGKSGALPGILAGIGLAVGSGVASSFTYWATSHPVIAATPTWSRFSLRLAMFLVACVWASWSILTAGIDESAELTRFATFPIRPLRLYLASIFSGLLEPRTLIFYPVIIAALAGFAQARPFPVMLLLPAFALTLFVNLAWARVGLNLTLNVVRHRRSAEIMGGGFIVALLLVANIPPVDASWLLAFSQGLAANTNIDDTIIVNASNALSSTPPVQLAEAAIDLSVGHTEHLAGQASKLLVTALIGFGLAYWLLLRFYKNTARAVRPPKSRSAAAPGRTRGGGTLRVLFEREFADLVRNPKARLLFAVPFFLAVVMRLISARTVAVFLAGPAADLWLLGAICTYASLMAMNFAQNTFAYDGTGLALLYAAPVSLRSVLVAKNLAIFAASGMTCLLLCLFYAVYLHAAPLSLFACVFLIVASQIPILVGFGNFLSSLAPRKYHASLRRRDRAPIFSTGFGFLAAIVAVIPSAAIARRGGHAAPDLATVLALAIATAGAVAFYLVTMPKAADVLERRRELVLAAITRE